MEADNKADLLIICRWANPIEDEKVMCGICKRKWFKPVQMSCGDTFCAGCIRDQLANGIKIRLKCNCVMKKKFHVDKSSQILLDAYEEERQALSLAG